MLTIFITFVTQIKTLVTMLNLDDFVKRLELIMDFHGLSGSSFADKIGIQRSSLSHLLSGRNKPSLDFVMKIVSELPEVDFNWILNGTGVFPKSDERPIQAAPQKITPYTAPLLFPEDIPEQTIPIAAQVNENEYKNEPIPPSITLENTVVSQNNGLIIENIVIFYTDGTFLDYKKQKKT